MNVRGGLGDDDGGALPEVLSSSADAPTAEERVRSAVAESGLKGWVRRHRLLLAGSLGVLLVAAGAMAYASTRPPPVDLTIGVSVVGFAEGGDYGFDEEGRPRRQLTYQVTAAEAGYVYSVVGVVGPGLTAASTTIGDVYPGLPGVGYLGATIDCEDPAWWEAEDSDYKVQISRTDEYGRVTVGDVPMGSTPIGLSDTLWHDDVIRTCLSAYARSLPPPGMTRVAVGGDGSRVDITLTLTNTGGHAVQVMPSEFAGNVFLRDGAWTSLPAGASATVTVPAEAAGCEGGPAVVPDVVAEDGSPTPDRGLPIRVSRVGEPTDRAPVGGPVVVDDRGRDGWTWVPLTPAFAAEVDAALATLCAEPAG